MECFYVMDNVLKIKEEYYFISLYNNCIYEILDDDLTVKKVAQIPFRFGQGYMEYSKLYYWNGKFFILPWFSDRIAIYNMEGKSYSYIQLNDDCKGLRYLKAFQRNELLYLIPCENKDIVIINMEEEIVVDRISIVVSKENEDKVISWCEVGYDINSIVIPQVYDKRLISFNYIEKKINYIESNVEDTDGFCGICDTKEGRWFIPRQANKLYFKTTMGMKEYHNFPDGYKCGNISFYKIVPDDNRIFLLPREANMLIVVYEDGTIINLMNIAPQKNNAMEEYMFFSNVWSIGEHWFCIESNTGRVFEIVDSNILIPRFFNEIESNIQKNKLDEEILYENPYREQTLEDFLLYIVRGN